MKKILYMAMSMNGYISQTNDSADFVSEQSWKQYQEKLKQYKNIIIGRKTYEIMCESGDLDGVDDITVVILSRDPNFEAQHPDHTVCHTCEDACAYLEKKGFTEILIAGGSENNASFLSARCVDEIIIDVEPIIIAKGKPLFQNIDKDVQLELLDIRSISDNLIQLHYCILPSL